MQRVTVYIDGLNLHYGVRSRGWERYQWIDPWALSENLLKPEQRLQAVHYFAAKFLTESGDPDKTTRQNEYLEALEAIDGLTVHYGYHQAVRRRCSTCGALYGAYEEKGTDVNIATRMVCDAYEDVFDVAILVSGDGDLAGPVRAIRARHPEKLVVAAFPPRRHSENIRHAATASDTIGRKPIRDSQLTGWLSETD